ncbi:MAG: T9SS type A sorting domain-containing protein [Bacteroidales bacterium]
MKRMVYVFVFLLIGFSGTGQVWVDSGAVWHLDFWTVGWGGFWKMEYEKDTMFQDRLCQKIATHEYLFTKNMQGQTFLIGPKKIAENFTSVSGDTVFYWNGLGFFVLYNFGASIGDSWIIADENPYSLGISELCDDTSRIIVTDTGSVEINGARYRTITVEPSSNSSIGIVGTYVERFGLLNTAYGEFQMLFPGPFQCDSMTAYVEWYFFKFKCFQDSSFALYNPSGQDCEYLLTTIGIEEPEAQKMTLYPNPVQDFVYIMDPVAGPKSVELYNYQGAMLKRYLLSGDENRVDLSELPQGVYLIVIKALNAQDQVFRIIRR